MIGDSRRLEGDRETRGEWKKSKKKGEGRAGNGKHARRRLKREMERESEGAKKKERAASTPATEIETLGEVKLNICDERQSEGEGERGE